MRRTVLFLLIISVCSFVSCTKDEEPADKTNQETPSAAPTPDTKEEVRYYVKYELSAYSAGQGYNYITISYSDVDGPKAIGFDEYGRGRAWEGIYGPFKKNDHVFLSCIVNRAMNLTEKISVSRNDEPFTIKAEYNKESENCKIEYTIDF